MKTGLLKNHLTIKEIALSKNHLKKMVIVHLRSRSVVMRIVRSRSRLIKMVTDHLRNLLTTKAVIVHLKNRLIKMVTDLSRSLLAVVKIVHSRNHLIKTVTDHSRSLLVVTKIVRSKNLLIKMVTDHLKNLSVVTKIVRSKNLLTKMVTDRSKNRLVTKEIDRSKKMVIAHSKNHLVEMKIVHLKSLTTKMVTVHLRNHLIKTEIDLSKSPMIKMAIVHSKSLLTIRETNHLKKKHGAEDDLEEKRPNRYANAFGRLDDEELKAHQKKQQERKEQKEQEDEVTFSKELDNKWDEEPVTRDFGKSDVKYTGYKKSGADNEEEEGGENGEAEDGKKGGRARHKHDATTRFKKQFDNENPHEKAYSATSDGPKPEELKSTDNALEGQLMPLNKYIAHCDVCSRRDAVTLIKEGKVTVNGELITEPGFKVTIEDVITLNDKKLVVQKNLIYILMNKPKGFITTTDDPKGRHTVMELVESHIEERVFPVGRLDRNTTGLLLLTNDGELTQKLSHPKHEIKKVYKATLDKNLSKDDFEKILKGVVLEDGPAPVDQLEYLETKNEIGLEIHSGKNRIVRRIFESLGYEVEKLDRVMYAGLTKKNVLRGKWRFLTKQEVINLKHIH
jgi:23S rRNA pseudouridine2605 synthase